MTKTRMIAALLATAVISSTISGGSPAIAAAHHPAKPKATAGYPPYWHKKVPKWCQEDMPCWIGSNADGRSDKASLKDWTHQMHIAQDDLQTVGVFLQDSDTDGDPMEVEKHSITRVHACKGKGYNRSCLARLDGYNHWVWVAGVDFPGAHPKH